MKFFERMDPIEREIMILEAVMGSVAYEGMEKAAQECYENIQRLRKIQKKGDNVTGKSVTRKD